jgi:8-oxo-dGTP pyrophosphatase MutT (NUDIX family)
MAGERILTLGTVGDGAGRVLLIRRRRPPFRGRLNGLGGRLEPGEDPLSGWCREVAEEAGLVPEHPRLRGVCRYRRPDAEGPEADGSGLLVVFWAAHAKGELREGPEGTLEWWPAQAVRRGWVADLVPGWAQLLDRCLGEGDPFSLTVVYRGEAEATVLDPLRQEPPAGRANAPLDSVPEDRAKRRTDDRAGA